MVKYWGIYLASCAGGIERVFVFNSTKMLIEFYKLNTCLGLLFVLLSLIHKIFDS